MMNKRIEWENIIFFPILHNKLEFALELKKQFREINPDCVAVEYPETLKEKIIEAIKKLPLLSVVYYRNKKGHFVYLLIEPTDAQVEAIRICIEDNIPVYFIDRDTEEYPIDITPMPDPYAIQRIGYFRYCKAYLEANPKGSNLLEDILREKYMAYHLQQLSKRYNRVLFLCGLFHLPGVLKYIQEPQAQVIGRKRKRDASIAHLHEDSSREIMTEMPYLAGIYEKERSGDGWRYIDKIKINYQLIKEAAHSYYKNNREEISPTQIKNLFKFARNWALLQGRLIPDLYQLIIAARGVADDDFAYEVWEKGSTYPFQTNETKLPVLRLKAEDLYLDERRIRFHRRIKTLRKRLVPVPLRKKFLRKKYAKQWAKEFGKYTICSYPPEDVVVEGFGEYVKKKAFQIRTEENTQVVPFTCSMLDGIDIRETIREWIQGRDRIFVKEQRPFRGKIGSVVIIFDPDISERQEDEKYPWKVTWLGEHEHESDMAFYSTPAGEIMVGPGISKCQYGGFMLTYPPMRVFDIWKDRFFDIARNKPERLLLAALDYSLEKNVVYVAPDPPSGLCQSIAARLGKKIIYIPIGAFSKITLNKIRQFHVLDGHHVRKYAHLFIET